MLYPLNYNSQNRTGWALDSKSWVKLLYLYTEDSVNICSRWKTEKPAENHMDDIKKYLKMKGFFFTFA